MPTPNKPPFLLLTLRILLILTITTGFAAALGLARHSPFPSHSPERDINLGAALAFLLLSVTILLLDALLLVLLARGALRPSVFAGINAVGTVFWGVVFVCDGIQVARGRQEAGGLGVVGVVFALYLGVLVYAVRDFLRQRRDGEGKREGYVPALPWVQRGMCRVSDPAEDEDEDVDGDVRRPQNTHSDDGTPVEGYADEPAETKQI